ncbi:hypothetical protein [Fusobacterium sp. PH5-44]|uniref:hypothetical protein n=1 Tax=unclassified Fusobacterium TaxID=2648384 RepID=UPI003D1AE609
MTETIKNENIEKEAGSFVGFVLLDTPNIDLQLLKKDLKEDWEIIIDEKNIKYENNSIIAEIGLLLI